MRCGAKKCCKSFTVKEKYYDMRMLWYFYCKNECKVLTTELLKCGSQNSHFYSVD